MLTVMPLPTFTAALVTRRAARPKPQSLMMMSPVGGWHDSDTTGRPRLSACEAVAEPSA